MTRWCYFTPIGWEIGLASLCVIPGEICVCWKSLGVQWIFDNKKNALTFRFHSYEFIKATNNLNTIYRLVRMQKCISIRNTYRSLPNHGHMSKPRKSFQSDKNSSPGISSTWVEVMGRDLKARQGRQHEARYGVCLSSFPSAHWPSASSRCSGTEVSCFRCPTGPVTDWLDIYQDQKQERGKCCLDLQGDGEGGKLLVYLFPVEESKSWCGWPSCSHLRTAMLSSLPPIQRECLARLCVVIWENEEQDPWLSRMSNIYSFCSGASVASSLWGEGMLI